jgi:tetrahydromethanopterin S-methyltransferase subunit A
MVQTERIRERIEERFREEVLHGRKEEGFAPDPAGFLVVHVDHKRGGIIVEHYDYKRQVKHKITGDDAESLCDTLLEKGLITRLDHATYVGRELAKAEAALKHGMRYSQDRSL